MVYLCSSCSHLVLQIRQLHLTRAAVDAAGSILQLAQLSLQPIHGARCQVHLQRQRSSEPRGLGVAGLFKGTSVSKGPEKTGLSTGGGRDGISPV